MTASRPDGGTTGVPPAPILALQGTKLALLRRLLDRTATVEELAAAAEVDRTVVRRHMSDLVSSGLVTARPLRGSRGRPRTGYGITTEGREVFFARYDVLLDSLTRGSMKRSGTKQTQALYAEAARTLADDLGFPTSASSAVRALREVGFEPEMRTERGRRFVVSHNCPVMRQAEKTPSLVCESFHSSLLTQGFRGSQATLRQTMARGASECIHVLNPR